MVYVVTQFFIPFFKNKIQKNQKKKHILDVFASFSMSFPNNLKLKNLLLLCSIFNVLIELILMLLFFKNQNTKKKLKKERKKCIYYYNDLIVIVEERWPILKLKTLSPSNPIFNQMVPNQYSPSNGLYFFALPPSYSSKAIKTKWVV